MAVPAVAVAAAKFAAKRYGPKLLKLVPLAILVLFLIIGLIVAMVSYWMWDDQNSCSSGGGASSGAYTPMSEGGPNISAARAAMEVANQKGASDFVKLALFETGWVESQWRNLASRAMPESLSLPNDPPPAAGDHDSVGILQQRTSQGWGSIPDLMKPDFQANTFVDRAMAAEGEALRAGNSAGKLAQSVQRSAFPEKYDQREADAKALMARVNTEIGAGGGAGGLTGAPLPGTDLAAPQAAPAGATGVTENAAVPTPSSTASTGSGCAGGGGGGGQFQVGEKIRITSDGKRVPRTATPPKTNQPDPKNNEFDIDIPAGPQEANGKALSAALSQIGVPYSWGGGGPAGPSNGIDSGAGTVGFDCSGLTEYAWDKAGVQIGGTTVEQVGKLRSAKIIPENAIPGDLVFWEGHVGMIAGRQGNDFIMVEAEQTGTNVKVDVVHPGWTGWYSPIKLNAVAV